jgi:NitT/TauT family transport system substrate-binding protein
MRAPANMRLRPISRRRFLANTCALSAGWLAGVSGTATAERRPEIPRIRLTATPAICLAPQYVAEGLLEAEGFTDVQYVKLDNPTPNRAVASGDADISMDAVWGFMARVDAGEPVTMLAGVHLGCYEVFGTDRVRSIKDLKGKTVPVSQIGDPGFLLLSSMAAYIGLQPTKDINWIVRTPAESMQLLAEGKVDAYVAFPPEPQELRAKGIGHVVVNTATDKPWSHYYCCMAAANREFVQNYPIACKRALRAILKATDVCAQQPETAARIVVTKGFAARYDYALQALKDVRYDAWRTYEPESTVRFHAVRLHEVGLINSSPQKLVTAGTDWRFLNELKKELKA